MTNANKAEWIVLILGILTSILSIGYCRNKKKKESVEKVSDFESED